MNWLQPLWASDMARAQTLLAPGYFIYQRGGLIAAPFIYLAVYMTVIAMMSVLTGRRIGTRALALRFAFSLVPIALVYILAHSWTFILMVIPVVPFLLTDPFGVGWNLLDLPRMSSEPSPLTWGKSGTSKWHLSSPAMSRAFISRMSSRCERFRRGGKPGSASYPCCY